MYLQTRVVSGSLGDSLTPHDDEDCGEPVGGLSDSPGLKPPQGRCAKRDRRFAGLSASQGYESQRVGLNGIRLMLDPTAPGLQGLLL